MNKVANIILYNIAQFFEAKMALEAAILHLPHYKILN